MEVSFAAAFALSAGIAIQNFPEGAIISLPLKSEGNGKLKSFVYGTLSGIVEPVAAFLTILLSNFIQGILPYLLAFAAGAMLFVVVEELIPEAYGALLELALLEVLGLVLLVFGVYCLFACSFCLCFPCCDLCGRHDGCPFW